MTSQSGSDLLRPAKPHIVLLPSAGMGHLTPFLRLAALLSHNCQLSLITTHPTVSLSESSLISRFLSSYPQVTQLQFHLLPLDTSAVNSADPFWLRFEATRRSAHLLTPLLSSLSPPPSALVYDVSLISPVLAAVEALDFNLPAYVLFTSSSRMLSLFAYYHHIAATAAATLKLGDNHLDIAHITPAIPVSSIPPFLRVPTSLVAEIFTEDGPKLHKLTGVLINSFGGLEETETDEGLPPVYTIGPFSPCEFEKIGNEDSGVEMMKWLDEQEEGSVVYVSFGSRTALSREQIAEVGEGLVKCGFRFLWVVKEKLVDREEEDEGSLDIVEKGKGLVVRRWVDQGEILGHKAVGGFVSHCGWNSVVEAAWFGVRVLCWPQHGDQRINSEVVERSGLGIWARRWAWGGDDPVAVVQGEEIAVKIKELMESQVVRVKALEIGEEAKRVAGVGGSREKIVKRLVQVLCQNDCRFCG